MKQKLMFILLLLIAFNLAGQPEGEGELNIYADPRIDSLLQLHITYNEAFPVIDGYRIHIFMESGNEALLHAEEVKEKFEEKYEEVPAYITFGEPYYRVRVGDFRTRLEASRFLERINRKYPNAWVIREKINLPTLPKYQ
jgi:hypothetical protein